MPGASPLPFLPRNCWAQEVVWSETERHPHTNDYIIHSVTLFNKGTKHMLKYCPTNTLDFYVAHHQKNHRFCDYLTLNGSSVCHQISWNLVTKKRAFQIHAYIYSEKYMKLFLSNWWPNANVFILPHYPAFNRNSLL